jgi:hypothetical protein
LEQPTASAPWAEKFITFTPELKYASPAVWGELHHLGTAPHMIKVNMQKQIK